MLELTEDRPKRPLELAGRSLLYLQLAALRGGGATSIAAVSGYRGDRLEGRGVELFRNPRWAETNIVMSLRRAAGWLATAPCLVSYSDIFYPIETVRRLIAATGDISIAYDRDGQTLWSARFADPLSDAETFKMDGSGRIIEIGRKPKALDEIEGQFWACSSSRRAAGKGSKRICRASIGMP